MKQPLADLSSEPLRLAFCLSYCISWEVAGKMSRASWKRLRAKVEEADALGDKDRYIIELYEESRPTVSEEMYLTQRIKRLMPDHGARHHLAKGIVECLPESMHEAAEKHALLREWMTQPRKAKGMTFFGKKVASTPPFRSKLHVPEAPLAESEREEDFAQFLAMPGFERAFAHYWHQPPKNRRNREVRGLVTIAAILSHFFRSEQLDEDSPMRQSLIQDCHFSESTVLELHNIVQQLEGNWYQSTDLAYRLMVDTREADRHSIVNVVKLHNDEARTTVEDRKTFYDVLSLNTFEEGAPAY
ncbi:MAG: hypothetical protein AAGA45_05315 [Verrucomicrobiota bacterium]